MAAVLTTLLLFAASWLLLTAGTRRGPGTYGAEPGRQWMDTPAAGAVMHRSGLRGLFAGLKDRKRSLPADPWLMPMLVHQLAALLEAGRSPQIIWAEAARSHAHRGGRDTATLPGAPMMKTDGDELLVVLHAADRAAALGHSIAQVLRHYAAVTPSGSAKDKARQHTNSRIWADLAACWDVAELSGAPLSKLLSRYAVQLEAELDAEAARQSALAGPRATVELLGWLPFFGLGLGLLMGVDPLAILFGTAAGLAALAAGAVMIAAGRIWSSKLVAAAAGRTT